MKAKFLLFITVLSCGFFYSQYTTGTVNLPTANMSVKIDVTASLVTLTLKGDSNSMLALGFGTNGMTPGNDGFIYNSNSNRDYTFSGVGITPTADAVQDWSQTSNTVSGSTRTVVATRSLTGGTGDYVFSNTPSAINIYYARRNGNLAIGGHSSLRDYATLNSTLGTNEVKDGLQKMALYPNPSKGVVYINQLDKVKSILVYDSVGNLVFQPKEITKSIDLNHLKSGVYYIEITNKEGSVSHEKLIKE